MQAEAIIAAAVGAITGGGGMRALGRLFGPERDERLAKYYRDTIAGLVQENTELRKEHRALLERIAGLEQRITDLEISPPGYLG